VDGSGGADPSQVPVDQANPGRHGGFRLDSDSIHEASAMSSLWRICAENTERLLCAMGRIEVPALRTILLIAPDLRKARYTWGSKRLFVTAAGEKK
jgi:hypothetical protein